jgi:hypothetical protein
MSTTCPLHNSDRWHIGKWMLMRHQEFINPGVRGKKECKLHEAPKKQTPEAMKMYCARVCWFSI